MALQGTLEDFGLDEVLAMLGAGGKAGRLRVSGPAGTGSIWVDAGRVVGTALGGDDVGADHAETLFHLLRLNDGEFAFLPGERPGVEVDDMAVPDVLALSSERIDEWNEIEQFLPSLEHWLIVSPTIDEPITLEPHDWEIVACIGPGRRIATVVRALGKGLVPGAREVVSLVQRGVLTVTEDAPPETISTSTARTQADGDLERQLPSVGAPDPDHSPGAGWAGHDGHDATPGPSPASGDVDEPAFDLFGRADTPSAGFDPAIPSPDSPPAVPAESGEQQADGWPTTVAGDPVVGGPAAVVGPAAGSGDVVVDERSERSAPAEPTADVDRGAASIPGLPSLTPPRPPAPPADSTEDVAESSEGTSEETEETEVNPRALLRLLNSVR